MPKIKTRRTAAKRLRRTGSGKFRSHHAGARHIATSKSTKRKRGLRKATTIAKADQRRVDRMIPY